MPSISREQKNFTGNTEQLDILLYAIKKNDIGFWNAWRDKHDDKKIVLNGANLINTKLPGINFQGADLKAVDLHGADLSGASFVDADLSGTYLSEALLLKADLSNAHLDNTYLYQANLCEAICRNTRFIRVNCREVNLQKAHLDSASIQSADLSDTDLSHCSLKKATCENVTFTGACIYGWKIREWHTTNLQCHYVYIDRDGKERLPHKRNFRAGEFEGYIKKPHTSQEVRKIKPPQGRALNHVFISHAPEDHDYVSKLAYALELNGITVWLNKDRLQPSTPWQHAIKNAIENGTYFILCLSNTYRKQLAAGMHEEISIALERLQKVSEVDTWFIPTKILRCDIPDKKIGTGRRLADLEWIDLSLGWNKGINKIVEVIKGT